MLMNGKIWTALLPLLLVMLYPQENQAQGQKFVFAEGMGSGLLVTANFDMRFKQGAREGLGARVGYTNVGIFHDQAASVVPLSINYVYGKQRSGLLVGFNTTFTFMSKDEDVWYYRPFMYGPEVGYRFRPMESGLAFQVTWSPMFNTTDDIDARWFGVGVGYAW